MSSVIGEDSLGDPVSGEHSLRVEQLDHFQQVLENSMDTSEERLEQLRRVGCRPTRRMPTVTESTAAVKGWTAAHRSSLRRTTHERSSASFVIPELENTDEKVDIIADSEDSANAAGTFQGETLRSCRQVPAVQVQQRSVHACLSRDVPTDHEAHGHRSGGCR